MALVQDAHITERISNTMIAYINGALNVAFRDAFYMTHKMQGEIADVAVYFKMGFVQRLYSNYGYTN